MIFKTFNNDIDKISAKWGVFGKSFYDFVEASRNRKIAIDDLFTLGGVPLKDAKKQAGSFWSYLYPKKEDIQAQMIDVDSIIPKLDSNNFDFNKWINELNEVDKKVKAGKISWQDYSNGLKDNQKWIAKWGQETQGTIRTQEELIKANENARQSALAHNEALKQQTLGAKVASVAMNLLSTAANMLVMYAVTKLITAWDDYKEKLREVAQETAEQAEKSSNNAQSLLDLQEKLDDNTVSAEDLTTAFREQMRTMGYTEEEIDNLIDKYNGLAGAIKGATEEALNNAKTDAYADMSTSGRSLTVEAKGKTNVNAHYSQNKELSEEIRRMLDDSPAILDGGIYRMDKNASAEDIYSYYLTLKDISQLIQETAKETGDETLLAGDSMNPTPYYQVSEALDALSESAELYGDAVSRLHNADAQLELANYLKTNDIDSKEAFDSYVNGIKNNTTYSEAYKQVLLEVANDAFPQFSAAAKDASDSLSDFPDEITDSFSNIWNSADFADTKEELLDLAKSGELTPETLSSVEEYGKLLSETGLRAEQVTAKILNMLTAQEKLASATEGLEKLSSAYKEFEELGFATAQSLESLPKAFKKLGGFDLFSEIVGDPTQGTEKIQQAFNDIVKQYLISQNTFSGLINASNSQIQSYIANLRQMGIANAEEVVNQVIEVLNQESELIDAAEEEYINYLEAKDGYDTEYLESVTSKNGQLAKALGSAYQSDYDNWCSLLSQKAEAYNEFVNAIGGSYDENHDVANNLIQNGNSNPSSWDIAAGLEAQSAYNQAVYEANKMKEALKLDLSTIKTNFGSSFKPSYSGSNDSSSEKAKSDTKETFDFIENKLESISKKTEKVAKAFEKTFTLSSTEKKFKQYLSQIDDEIKANQTAVSTYQNKLNSIGLSSDWAQKIKDGNYSIEDVVNNDTLTEQINEYQKYYDKLVSAQEKITELEEERLDTQNIYAEKVIEYQEKEMENLEKSMDKKSSLSYKEGVYNEQMTLYDSQIAKLKELQKTVSKGSDAWNTYQEQIENLNDERLDTQGSFAEKVINIQEKEINSLDKAISKKEKYISLKEKFGGSASEGNLTYIQNRYAKELTLYDNQIDKLKELQKTVSKGTDAWNTYQEQIESNKESMLDVAEAMAEVATQIANLPLDKYEKYVEKNESKAEYYSAKAENYASAKNKNKMLQKQIDLAEDNNNKAQDTADTTAQNINVKINDIASAKKSDKKGKTKKEKKQVDALYSKVKECTKSKKEIPVALLQELYDNGFTGLYMQCGEYNAALLANETAQATADLMEQTTKTEIADLQKAKFDNISSIYDNKQQHITDEASIINSKKDLATAKGYLGSQSWYNQLIALEKKNKSSLGKELKDLQKSLDEGLSDGSIVEYSSQWYDMVDGINATTEALEQSKIALEEYENQLRQVEFDNFD